MMKPTFLIISVILSVYFCAPQPKAKAMEPVTIALLPPVDLKVAEVARLYVIRGQYRIINGRRLKQHGKF